jgi:MFS family permease
MTGFPLLLLGYLGLAVSSSFLGLTLSLVLVGAGGALAGPGLTAAQSLAVSDAEQGSVAGLASSAQALGRMLGPLLATALYGVRLEYPYWVSAGLIVLALLFFLTRQRQSRG